MENREARGLQGQGVIREKTDHPEFKDLQVRQETTEKEDRLVRRDREDSRYELMKGKT